MRHVLDGACTMRVLRKEEVHSYMYVRTCTDNARNSQQYTQTKFFQA